MNRSILERYFPLEVKSNLDVSYRICTLAHEYGSIGRQTCVFIRTIEIFADPLHCSAVGLTFSKGYLLPEHQLISKPRIRNLKQLADESASLRTTIVPAKQLAPTHPVPQISEWHMEQFAIPSGLALLSRPYGLIRSLQYHARQR